MSDGLDEVEEDFIFRNGEWKYRCEYEMPFGNGRCPRPAEEDSDYCKIHKEK